MYILQQLKKRIANTNLNIFLNLKDQWKCSYYMNIFVRVLVVYSLIYTLPIFYYHISLSGKGTTYAFKKKLRQSAKSVS